MRRYRTTVSISVLSIILYFLSCSPALAKDFLKFIGGPSGGTFQYFSNGIALRLSKNIPELRVSNLSSKGSVENIRKVNTGKADFGIAYSGDLYLAKNGRLTGDTKKYLNVRAVAFLYQAPAQLVVLKESGISEVTQLKNKRVALGAAGSGAAASGERFFKLVGLWDDIDRHFFGYTNAANAMKNGEIDAMWIISGYPTRAIIELSSTHSIDLLHVYPIAAKHGLSEELPFYQPTFIPANTYEGVNYATASFFDAALWIANSNVNPEIVHKALMEIYSDEGLAYLKGIKSTASQMSLAGGLTGIITPLHKGADQFWNKKGSLSKIQ